VPFLPPTLIETPLIGSVVLRWGLRTKAGLTPPVMITSTPTWANHPFRLGPGIPDAVALGEFALAAARRSSGNYPGAPDPLLADLERAKHQPRPDAAASHRPCRHPSSYRAMVNQAAASIKRVHADNVTLPALFAYAGLRHSELLGLDW
jgi:integrase